MTGAESLFNQGVELSNQEKYSEAEHAFRKVLELQPDLAEELMEEIRKNEMRR